jgi:hypothetical protein
MRVPGHAAEWTSPTTEPSFARAAGMGNTAHVVDVAAVEHRAPAVSLRLKG